MNLQAMSQRVEHWLIEKRIPYARDPRTHSDAQIAQIGDSIADFGFKPEPGRYQGRHHRRATVACSPRESSCSKMFPSPVEISVPIAGFVVFVIATAILTTYPFPNREGTLTLPKDLVLRLLFFGVAILVRANCRLATPHPTGAAGKKT